MNADLTADDVGIIATWVYQKHCMWEADERIHIVDPRLSVTARNEINAWRDRAARERWRKFRKTSNPFAKHRFFISRNSASPPVFGANFVFTDVVGEAPNGVFLTPQETFRIFIGPLQAVATSDPLVSFILEGLAATKRWNLAELKQGCCLEMAREALSVQLFEKAVVTALRKRGGDPRYTFDSSVYRP